MADAAPSNCVRESRHLAWPRDRACTPVSRLGEIASRVTNRFVFRRLCRRRTTPATPSAAPSSVTLADAVALDGRDMPSTVGSPLEMEDRESGVAAPFAAPLVVWPPVVGNLNAVASGPAHVPVSSVAGDGPADASASGHADPEGAPPARLPPASFAEKSSDAVDGSVPQLVPRLTSVGTPGEASAVEQVAAFVGSSAEPIPAADPPNAAVALATASTRTRESDVETFVWLASTVADGPDVAGVGVEPSGAAGSGSDADAVVGTVALVPGAVADVEPDCPVDPAVLELDVMIGSLDPTVAGPALPPLAEADPPAVEPFAPGWMFGCADTVGPSARAGCALTQRNAMAAVSSTSFLIS
jgi:hypothetical protein